MGSVCLGVKEDDPEVSVLGDEQTWEVESRESKFDHVEDGSLVWKD